MIRICPACATRNAQLVDPRCVICSGSGVVTLGDAALAFHEPPVVARAIGIALEAAAREIDLTLTLSDDRHAPIKHAVVTLRRAGLIENAVIRPIRKSTTARQLAERAADIRTEPYDQTLSEAPAYEYAEDDRPNARGLPLLSENGHPSHLARVADPAEPGRSTRQHVRERQAEKRQAAVLANAATEAVRIKQRKGRR